MLSPTKFVSKCAQAVNFSFNISGKNVFLSVRVSCDAINYIHITSYEKIAFIILQIFQKPISQVHIPCSFIP